MTRQLVAHLLYCVWCYCSWVSSKRRCFCGVDRQCLPIFDVLLHWGLPLVVRTWTRAKALRAPHSRGSPNLSRSLIGRTISWAWNQPYNWKKKLLNLSWFLSSFAPIMHLPPHKSEQFWVSLQEINEMIHHWMTDEKEMRVHDLSCMLFRIMPASREQAVSNTLKPRSYELSWICISLCSYDWVLVYSLDSIISTCFHHANSV